MPYNYKEIEQRLLKLWFRKVRQKWSHALFSNGNIIFPVPNHGWKDISIWVEKQILKLLELTAEEFKQL